MQDPEKWSPAGQDPWTETRRHHANAETGELLLQNISNKFFGVTSTVFCLVVAGLFFNRTALDGPDASPFVEIAWQNAGLFLISISAYLVLASPVIFVLDGVVRVRNPLKIYRIPLERVQDVHEGFMGFPVLTVDGAAIRLMALEESLATRSSGGSGLRELLVREIAASQEMDGQEGVSPSEVSDLRK
jgi:hypothetical protein